MLLFPSCRIHLYFSTFSQPYKLYTRREPGCQCFTFVIPKIQHLRAHSGRGVRKEYNLYTYEKLIIMDNPSEDD